jgi:hypothetical protein
MRSIKVLVFLFEPTARGPGGRPRAVRAHEDAPLGAEAQILLVRPAAPPRRPWPLQAPRTTVTWFRRHSLAIAMNCPNCSASTDALDFDGVYGAPVTINLCFPCYVLWLDKTESILLSARGTLDLFRILHEHCDAPHQSLGGRLACPRCQRRLSLSQDIGKAGRFTYYSCPAGDGRLTPFSEFLKEKQFVRSLNPAEQARLRADVKSVQCASCGAPVDLSKGFQCAHCGAPITVLDHDAVEKTLRELETAEERYAGDPEEKAMRARALASMEALRTEPAPQWHGFSPHPVTQHGLADDLLSASLRFIFGRL